MQIIIINFKQRITHISRIIKTFIRVIGVIRSLLSVIENVVNGTTPELGVHIDAEKLYLLPLLYGLRKRIRPKHECYFKNNTPPVLLDGILLSLGYDKFRIVRGN